MKIKDALERQQGINMSVENSYTLSSDEEEVSSSALESREAIKPFRIL